MHQKGSVFFKKDYIFKDGSVGDKLLILLNTPTGNEDCLFVKTTSQAAGRLKQNGCHKHPKYPQGEYFMPADSKIFRVDTWLVLYEVDQIPLNDVISNGYIKLSVSIPNKTITLIIDCLFAHHEDDISGLHEQWLRPPFQASCLKLQERFNNR